MHIPNHHSWKGSLAVLSAIPRNRPLPRRGYDRYLPIGQMAAAASNHIPYWRIINYSTLHFWEYL